MPCLQWVAAGVYRFGGDVKRNDKAISLTVAKDDGNKDNNDNTQQLSFLSGRMDYLPTGNIRKTMDSLKDDIMLTIQDSIICHEAIAKYPHNAIKCGSRLPK